MNIRTIIVDDMPLSIASLEADLKDNHPEIEIVATAEGVLDAAKVIKKEKPTLIFLDIHMGDGDGFDLLEIIPNSDTLVIFTTASKDHAIKAFQFDAVDYLLKPVDLELLAAAIQKVKDKLGASSTSKLDAQTKTIALNTQSEIRVVELSDIIRLEAMGNYTKFYLGDTSHVLVTRTLKDYDSTLPDNFIRVHQSHLVNRAHIKAYVKTEGGYLKMKDGTNVPVSVRKKSYVMDLLK